MPAATEAPPKDTTPAAPPADTTTTTTAPAKEGREDRAPVKEGSFIERITGRKPPAEKKTEKEAEGKTTDGKPAAPPAKRKTIEPPPVTATQPPVDYDKIAEATARGVATAITKGKETDKDESKALAGLSDDQKETFSVLERMGKDYKDEAGKAEKYLEGIRKTKEYRANWEKEHPGERWDKEDEQHDAFFDQVDVDWDDTRFMRTLARIESENATKTTEEKYKSKISEFEERDRRHVEEKKVEPIIRTTRDNAAKSFFGELGEPFAKVLGSEGQMNKAEVDRLVAEDPLNIHAFKAVENVEVFTSEITKLSLTDEKTGKPLYPYNEKDGLHQFIARFVDQEQAAMKQLSDDDQRDAQGRRFLTVDEFEKLSPAQRPYYWHYTTDDLVKIFVAREAARVKNIVSDFENTATKRGFVKKDATGSATGGGAGNGSQRDAMPEKPRSPSGAVEPIVTHSPRSGAVGKDSAVSSFEQRWLGRA